MRERLPKAIDGPWAWPAMIGLTIATRLPALLFPRPIDDEAVYAVVARVMLAGGLPYRDAIERKPPLLFGVYWVIFWLFGACNWLALHLVAVGWVLLTMAGLFVLARRLDGRRAGLLTALAYALVQPWATAKNLAFNGEVMMNLPLVWAYALVLPPRRGGLVTPAAAGTLLGLAFLLKQPAAIAALPVGLYLLSSALRRDGLGWSRAIGQTAALTTGFAAVLGGTVAILWLHGVLGEAWVWTVTDHGVPHVFWLHGLEHTLLFVLIALPLVLPLAAWRPLRLAWQGRQAELLAVLGWLAVSVVGAAAGGRFYPHYYIQIVPPLAVLAGITYARVKELAPAPRAHWVSLRLAGIWLSVAVLVSLAVQSIQLLHERPPSAAGSYVRAQAGAADRLFVWGQQTSLYLDAGILPASRYIATFALTGYIFGGPVDGVATQDRIVPGAWNNLSADFRDHPPAFIIDTQAGSGDPYPMTKFPVLARIVASQYRWEATFVDGVVYRRRAGR